MPRITYCWSCGREVASDRFSMSSERGRRDPAAAVAGHRNGGSDQRLGHRPDAPLERSRRLAAARTRRGPCGWSSLRHPRGARLASGNARHPRHRPPVALTFYDNLLAVLSGDAELLVTAEEVRREIDLLSRAPGRPAPAEQALHGPVRAASRPGAGRAGPGVRPGSSGPAASATPARSRPAVGAYGAPCAA